MRQHKKIHSSSSTFSRKCFSEKQDPKLRQQLGSIIQCFANSNKGAKKVVQRSVVQIISSIVNASGSSPLLEIDIENVLRFLTALTNTINDVDVSTSTDLKNIILFHELFSIRT